MNMGEMSTSSSTPRNIAAATGIHGPAADRALSESPILLRRMTSVRSERLVAIARLEAYSEHIGRGQKRAQQYDAGLDAGAVEKERDGKSHGKAVAKHQYKGGRRAYAEYGAQIEKEKAAEAHEERPEKGGAKVGDLLRETLYERARVLDGGETPVLRQRGYGKNTAQRAGEKQKYEQQISGEVLFCGSSLVTTPSPRHIVSDL